MKKIISVVLIGLIFIPVLGWSAVVKVTTTGYYIRSHPNFDATPIKLAVIDETYKVIGREGDWYQIQLSPRTIGWINVMAVRYLSSASEKIEPSPTQLEQEQATQQTKELEEAKDKESTEETTPQKSEAPQVESQKEQEISETGDSQVSGKYQKEPKKAPLSLQSSEQKPYIPAADISLGIQYFSSFNSSYADRYDYSLGGALSIVYWKKSKTGLGIELNYIYKPDGKVFTEGIPDNLIEENKSELRLFPIFVNFYYRFRPEKKLKFYLGAGLGYYFLKIKDKLDLIEPNTDLEATYFYEGICGQIVSGWQFSSGGFGEIKYLYYPIEDPILSGLFGDKDYLDGALITLGIKF